MTPRNSFPPSIRSFRCAGESVRHGLSSGTPTSFESFWSRGHATDRHEPAHGASAPSLSDLPSSGTISSGANVSTSPKPRQVGHTPSGLLNENSAGSGRIAGVPQFEHSQRSL